MSLPSTPARFWASGHLILSFSQVALARCISWAAAGAAFHRRAHRGDLTAIQILDIPAEGQQSAAETRKVSR